MIFRARSFATSDSEAFYFGVKFLGASLLLLMAAHFGVSALAMQWYATSVVDERAHAHLASVRASGGAQAQPAYIRAAYASGVPATKERTWSLSAVTHEYDKVLYLDLPAHTIKLFHQGTAVGSFPILSVPPENAGAYLHPGVFPVVERITDQYSPIGGVHLPYAVRFSEHLLIHGWPYAPNGTPVAKTYAGSGVRLASGDAARVFQFADESTVVFVDDSEDEVAVHPVQAIELREESLPQLNGIAYALADMETGEVLLERNAERPRAIASISKLMTALVAQEYIPEDREIPVTYQGERYVADDLLSPLLMRSDNSIANEFAAFQGTEWFITTMNAKARALGMEHTSFADPSGLSPNNVSSAHDLVRLARYLYTEHEHILAISKQESDEIVAKSGKVWRMKNQNRYAGDAYFVGGKLGFTDEARRTGLSIASVPVGDEVRTVAIVVLGSNDWKRDTDLLIDWLKRSGAPHQLTGNY